jgi:hypothetical protein
MLRTQTTASKLNRSNPRNYTPGRTGSSIRETVERSRMAGSASAPRARPLVASFSMLPTDPLDSANQIEMAVSA